MVLLALIVLQDILCGQWPPIIVSKLALAVLVDRAIAAGNV